MRMKPLLNPKLIDMKRPLFLWSSTRSHTWWRKALCGVLLIFSPCWLIAGDIRGVVSEADTGNNLRNARIEVLGTGRSVLAGPGGRFVVSGLREGAVTLRASYAGLESAELTVQVPSEGSVDANFRLKSAFAQGEEVYELEAFEVITEARGGTARAVMEQKVALNPVKVVSADSLGNISEGNAGEFLKLMPGVSLDYVEADARAVRISGLNPKYGNVLLEGLFVPSAGSSNIGTGRVFEFEQLSMDSVELVQLTKTPTPDQPSALSGTVDLVTQSAFDFDGEVIDLSFGFATNSYYSDLDETPGWQDQNSRKWYANYSLKYMNTFMDGKLGVAFGTSHHATIAAQKHIWFWHNDYDDNPNNNDTEVPEYSWMWFQDGPKPTVRENYFARVDYRHSDQLSFFARWDYSIYEARFYNRTLSLRPTEYDLSSEYSRTRQTVLNGSISNESNQFMEKLGDTMILTLGADYQRDDLSIRFRINRGIARNWYESLENGHFTDYRADIKDISWTWTRDSDGDTDLQFTQLSGPDWRNPANYAFTENAMQWHERNSRDNQSTIRLDFAHDWTDWNLSQELKYGVMYNTRDLEVHRYGGLWASFTGADGLVGTADDPNPGDFVDRTFRMDFDTGTNLEGIRPLSPWKLYDHYRKHPGDWVENDVRNGDQRRRNNWYFEEEILSAYVTDVFHFGKFEIAPGLRWESSKPKGTGWDAVNNRPVTAKGDTTDVLLGYLHANYELRDDLVLRFAYHDSITRADIANLIPGISNINETEREMNANNPNLKEEKAQTYFFTVDKFFEPVGLISVSAFHRVWKDRQISGGSEVLGADGYGGDSSFSGYTLFTQTNASRSISLNGLEIDFSKQFQNVPKPLSSLGVFANFTYLDYEDERFFVGAPEYTANGGFNASIGHFSARLNANYIGDILTWAVSSFDESTGKWSETAQPLEYQKERLFLDLNLDYMIRPGIRIFLDARNLTNTPSQYTYRGDADNFVRILKTGTIWKIGVKASF